METTFISIHDLTPEARILYSSDSVIDILGYTPDELVNRSAWDLFPVAEVASARNLQQKRVQSDKAAVLAYCRIANKKGVYIGCEVCFTVVYDVMVVCTSVYRQGIASQRRALEAPIIRRLFSSSPRDPRYHMLTHLSHKFSVPQKTYEHEPRAALFLNRFTRTLSIMYATNSVEEVIGISADALRGRSFYYCITENCLQDAVKCLENAKGNDSIAYLRFWFRDPRQDDTRPLEDDDTDLDNDVEMTGNSEDNDDDGAVTRISETSLSVQSNRSDNSDVARPSTRIGTDERSPDRSRTSSGDSTRSGDTHEAIFGQTRGAESSTSSLAPSPDRTPPAPVFDQPIELEAVVSCASDGLVVCLRRARPMIPPSTRPTPYGQSRGIFAAPWASEPTLPPYEHRAPRPAPSNFAPSLGPQGAMSPPPRNSGPERNDFMNSIREQAVFAWALTGINGSLATFGKGKPSGEAVPADGLPIWASDPRLSRTGSGGFDDDGRPNLNLFGDPGLD